MSFETLDLLKLCTALLIGCMIGAEREYRGKAAGFRTLILISLGSCIFTLISIKITTTSPDRIMANIVTGIGFLGAGVIFKDDSRVMGLTTASTIWITAALGMAAGAGFWHLAGMGSVLVVVVLVFFRKFQNYIDVGSQKREYHLTMPISDGIIDYYEHILRAGGLKPYRIKTFQNREHLVCFWSVAGSYTNHERVIGQLIKDQQIVAAEFVKVA